MDVPLWMRDGSSSGWQANSGLISTGTLAATGRRPPPASRDAGGSFARGPTVGFLADPSLVLQRSEYPLTDSQPPGPWRAGRKRSNTKHSNFNVLSAVGPILPARAIDVRGLLRET